jgi:hypothetical protein
MAEIKGNQMGPPFKKRRTLTPTLSAEYRSLSLTQSELLELNMVPDNDHELPNDDQKLIDDDYAEEEGYYVYPDPEAGQVAW